MASFRKKRPRTRVRAVRGSDLKVAPDMMVKLAYRLYDQDGKLVEATPRDAPVEYVHGFAKLIPGLDAGVTGARVGEKRRLELVPDEAFGEIDEEALLEVDRDELTDDVEVGDVVVAEAPDGKNVAWTVREITDDLVIVDVNHPLAGQCVSIEVTVLSIRPATDAELEGARAEADEQLVDDDAIDYRSERDGAEDGNLLELRTSAASPRGASAASPRGKKTGASPRGPKTSDRSRGTR